MSAARLRLRWLEAASRDLNAIASFIARFSETAARNWLQTVDERVALLTAHPFSGEAYPRNRFMGNYVLYYTVGADKLVIRGIIHSARRLRRTWPARRGKMTE